MLTVIPLLLVFALGLVVLTAGAHGTLHGSVGIARWAGMSQLAIGLTVVAFGTSCPELSLDVMAALKGQTELALGDLIGSNIANVGLILGIAALLCPLHVQMRLLRAEVPIAISASLLVWGLAFDGQLGRQDGILMLAAFILFLGYSYRAARQESASAQAELVEAAPTEARLGKSALIMVLGLAGLVIGAQLMVYSSVKMARLWGVSELMVGLTIVAVGTSLPELATAIVAGRRREVDIVFGNVIGSNIFNLLFILALVAIIADVPAPANAIRVDLPVMIAFVVVLVPLMARGMCIQRNEGLLLLAGYVAFLGWQIFATL